MKKRTLAVMMLWMLCGLSTHAELDKKCANFRTQDEAQAWHDSHKEMSKLDRDKDGEACECLPGGSAEGAPFCRVK